MVYVACTHKLVSFSVRSQCDFTRLFWESTHIARYNHGVHHPVEGASLGTPAPGKGDENAAGIAIVAHRYAGRGPGVEQCAVEGDLWVAGAEH